MSVDQPQILTFDNLSDLLVRIGLPAPQHPLVALVDYNKSQLNLQDAGSKILLNFYKIAFKQSFEGSVRYGAGQYDFRAGGLAFLAPHQIVEMPGDPLQYEGFVLYFHPDLLRGYPLATGILRYGFFSYASSEALFLSEKEKQVISRLFATIEDELEGGIDAFSQDVLVSQIELLLQHSNRFYNRQFLTRKPANNELIDQMQAYLLHRFNDQTGLVAGLPSPPELADHLKVSPRYLSDMLKSLTGITTQQHIHLHLVEKAKELLATKKLSTAEIAYRLGFEHPQSFNKLFKQKTNLTPALFRRAIFSSDN